MTDPLKKKFQEKALALFTEMRGILKEHGDLKVDEVKLRQVLGGARGIKMMMWETSQLDAIEGIRFRGYSIPQLQEKLPPVQKQILEMLKMGKTIEEIAKNLKRKTHQVMGEWTKVYLAAQAVRSQ